MDVIRRILIRGGKRRSACVLAGERRSNKNAAYYVRRVPIATPV